MNFRPALECGSWEPFAVLGLLAAFAVSWRFFASLPRRIVLLRVFSFFLLCAALLKPALDRFEEKRIRPRLAVLIDAGPGMSAQDDAGSSRLSRAALWLSQNRSRIEENAEVSLYAGAETIRRVDWSELKSLLPGRAYFDPISAASDLAAAAEPPERVWLFSDGSFGELSSPAAGQFPAPLDAIGVGPRKNPPRIAVSGITVPDFVFLHSRFEAAVSLQAEELSGSKVSVSVFKGEKKAAESSFLVSSDFETLRATWTLEADALGSQEYRVEAAASTGLRSKRAFKVEVIRQKHRIMYLAGRPSFEYAHLRAQLKGDPNHELVSFVILRNPEDVSPAPDDELSLIPFPASEIFVKDLGQFDLFILENFAYDRFNLPIAYLQNLKNFIAAGGALLIVGGENAFSKGGYRGSPLEETLPVSLLAEQDDFVSELVSPRTASVEHPFLSVGSTPEESRALWASLPPLDGYARFSDLKPGAQVLLSHPSAQTSSGRPLPIVAVREFGKGKVMIVGSDSTWRWKLAGGLDWKLASFYPRFWSRAIQYLTGSLDLKKVKFAPLPDRLPPREPLLLSLRVFDENFRPLSGPETDLRLSWLGPGGAASSPPVFEKEPGLFQIELGGLSEGRHRVKAHVRRRGQGWGEDEISFLWEPIQKNPPLDRSALKTTASGSGGSYADLQEADPKELLSRLSLPRIDRTVQERIHFWHWSAWAIMIAASLCAEWLMRRRRGHL